MKISYLAGFFDGEGSIIISKCKRKNRPTVRYDFWISISQKRREVLDQIKKEFGGRVHPDGNGGFTWRLDANRAKDILEEMIPILIVKKREAKIGIKFQMAKGFIRPGSNQFSKKEFPKKTIFLREEYRQELLKERRN